MSEESLNGESNHRLAAEELRRLRELPSRSEIRRAYAKLVRRFSPETHASEFQLIRAAYETALKQLEWREQAGEMYSAASEMIVDPPESLAIETPLPPHLQNSNDKSQDAPDHQSDSTPQQANQHSNQEEWLRQELQKLWRDFSQAPNSVQWNEMRRHCEMARTIPEAFLMLYWMQKLRPDLGSRVLPHQILTQALRQFAEDPRFHKLMAQELADDLRSTTNESLSGILNVMRNPVRLADYLRLRWSIIAERSAWVQLRRELNLVRRRLSFEHQRRWIELLLTVVEYVVFCTVSVHQNHN